MRQRQTRIVLLVLLAASVSLAACAVKFAALTPKGKQYYTATQIAQRVGELQNAVIEAEVSGAVPEAVAITIVKTTVSINRTLRELPLGWQQTVTTAWAELKKHLPPQWQTHPIIGAAFMAIDVILGMYAGQGAGDVFEVA